MKNIETIAALIAADVASYHETCQTMQNNVKTLEKVYGETITGTPAETVAQFVKAVGYEAAAETLATLINRHGWDGRISHRVKTWAESLDGAWDEAAAEKMGIYTNRIHMAHLDQLAAAMMKYEPEPAEAETAEAVEAEAETAESAQAETESAQAETESETEPAETLKEAETMPETIFPNLRRGVNEHYDAQAAKFAADLETITAAEALNSWYYTDRMTPAALKMVKAADPAERLPEAARLKMVKRFERENEKQRAERLGRLDRAEAAAPLTAADIVVTWAKNRTWGMNPTAEVTAGTRRTTGTASGCGYDKESAAIAEAFNRHPSIMRALYEHAERGGNFEYSVYKMAGVPWFDGGCGVSCFRSVFAGIGFKWEDVSHRRGSFDVYRLTRNA